MATADRFSYRRAVALATTCSAAMAAAARSGAGPSASSSSQHMFDREYWIGKASHVTEHALDTSIQVIGIIVVYLIVRTILNRTVNGIAGALIMREERNGVPAAQAGRLKTLSGLFKSMVGYVTFFIFGVLVFKAIGFDIMPFITTAGVIGLAIGFGAQKLVKDVISGFFIIVDNLFVVGDTIIVGAITGEVQEMGMRVTRLHDLSGRVVTIPNGDIGTVTNLSRYPVEDFIEIGIAPTADITAATEAVAAAGKELFEGDTHQLKAVPRLVGITAFSAASITIRISVTSDPQALPVEQMRVREAARLALAKAGILPA